MQACGIGEDKPSQDFKLLAIDDMLFHCEPRLASLVGTLRIDVPSCSRLCWLHMPVLLKEGWHRFNNLFGTHLNRDRGTCGAMLSCHPRCIEASSHNAAATAAAIQRGAIGRIGLDRLCIAASKCEASSQARRGLFCRIQRSTQLHLMVRPWHFSRAEAACLQT